MSKKIKEIKLSSKTLFDGESFRIVREKVRLPDGKIALREISVTKHQSVCIVPLDQDQNVILIRSFRSGLGKARLELPGGRFYKNRETPRRAAARECLEETGYEPSKMELLYEIRGGGSWTYHTYYFLGTKLRKKKPKPDWDEFIEVVKLPFAKYLRRCIKAKEAGRSAEFKALILVAERLGLAKFKI
jgi:ADP-ribose pyrophosphatase